MTTDSKHGTVRGLRFYSCYDALVLVGQDDDDSPVYECSIHHERYIIQGGSYLEVATEEESRTR